MDLNQPIPPNFLREAKSIGYTKDVCSFQELEDYFRNVHGFEIRSVMTFHHYGLVNENTHEFPKLLQADSPLNGKDPDYYFEMIKQAFYLIQWKINRS